MQHLSCAAVISGAIHRLIMGFSGSKCAGSLSLAIPNATFMGEVQGEKLARSVTQIFSSLLKWTAENGGPKPAL